MLTAGTTWVYWDDRGREVATRVMGFASIADAPCVEIRGCAAGVSEWRAEGADVSYWSMEQDRLMLHAVGEGDRRLVARTPVALYRPDATRGMSWGGTFFSRDAKTGLEETVGLKVIAGGRQRVTVPAGEFDAFHVVEEWSVKGRTAVHIENWWTQKDGVVKQVYRRYERERVVQTYAIELKLAVIGKQ